MRVALTINGEAYETDVWPGESLLYALRERLGLPGSKNACEQGECGSCSVLLDGKLVCACLVLAAQADGHDLAPVGLGSVHEARADELAVEQHRAGAALALLAGALGTRELESLAQHEQQALRAVDVGLALLPVDLQLDPHTRHLASARRVSTPRAWRR